MFAKLCINRFMKAKGISDAAVVEFIGKVQRMVNVHKYGLKDKPGLNSNPVQYTARPLLGLTTDERHAVEDIIIKKPSG
ncbi:TPA: phage virion morphogenesis protein [Klebsiella aerogenes]|nr:phage virion morphogenesis protein [Klebsiella aerogenes]